VAYRRFQFSIGDAIGWRRNSHEALQGPCFNSLLEMQHYVVFVTPRGDEVKRFNSLLEMRRLSKIAGLVHFLFIDGFNSLLEMHRPPATGTSKTLGTYLFQFSIGDAKIWKKKAG